MSASLLRATCLATLALALVGRRAAAQLVDDARDSVRAGRYASAIALLSRVNRADSEWIDVQKLLAKTLATVGRYDDAERAATRATSEPGGKALYTTLGEILAARGRTADAEAAYHRAISDGASDSLTAAVDLAILRYDRGDHARALSEFDHFIDVYNQRAANLTVDELVAVGTACRYLGTRNPQLFKDALKAFDQATALDGDDLEPKIRAGELFVEKYNGQAAVQQLEQVLQVNPNEPRALLAAARRASLDDDVGADSLVARALAVNDNFVDARVLRASRRLDAEDYAGAEAEIDRALAVNPGSAPAWATMAAARYLAGDARGYEEAVRRSLGADSSGAALYDVLAEAAAHVRRYSEAADFAARAVARDSIDWRGWGDLGMNQLRLGRIPEGRASLTRSFGGDPYNVWIKNTLDLLDTFKGYAEVRSDHFLFVIDTSESELLAPYLRELGERAYATFARRYGYEPPLPIRIEVYRSHADFSVRTVGLAGLGALGVSFGSTLAFDSPSAKDAGPFNWGSTVWHELAHTFTLGMTGHRVPRWLSEGLSVYEEHHARPGWGFDVTPGFLRAFAEGRLVPPSRMNDGFMRPAYPEQVQYSYYEASLVCDLVAQQWGDSALTKLLREYRDGATTEAAFRRVLGEPPATFDRRFDAYVRQRFAVPLANMRSFALALQAGRRAFDAGHLDTAAIAFEAAKRAFPEYGGDDSPYKYLASIAKTRGDTRRAADELTHLVAVSEIDDAAQVELSSLREQLGDIPDAIDALAGALYIDPYDPVVHQRLAALADRAGDHATVVRERRALVALHPVDRADALYRLALAYRDAGDTTNARRSVLRALEDAPNFADAQRLLLSLHGVAP